MTVRTRLVVFGALLPTLALLAASAIAAWRFRQQLIGELDRRLLAQAAVESVGLFDAPGGAPHVHVPDSPIAEVVKDFAPEAGVYDATGVLVARVPDRSKVPERVPLAGDIGVVRMSDAVIAGVERRVLELPVRAPDGDAFTLWMGASLAPLDATMSSFYRATLSGLAVLAVTLLVIPLLVARRLAGRIEVMTAFLPRLRDGDTSLPPDPARDELGALREALRDAAARLAVARGEQDRLLASAAHELRTPLTILRTELDLALRKERPIHELRAALQEARADVDRLGVLATELLDLQAIRHVDFERAPGDLSGIVREACAGLRTLADARGVELRVVAPASAAARFDERGVRQAIDNLVGNALKHAPVGTAIDVALDHVERSWRVVVADRGPGIAAEEAERIFEPFHRLGDGPGAGLGLAIVREVALRHGGRVWLDLDYRPGARFVLELGDAIDGAGVG